MIPAKYDFEIPRGGAFELALSLNDQSGAVNFASTYSGARMYVRTTLENVPDAEETAVEPVYELTTTDLKLVISTTTLYIRLTAAQTAALPFISGYYDIELYSGTGASEVVDKMMHGTITVVGEATV